MDDEELALRVNTRRDKLMARWLAALLSLDEAALSALTGASLEIPNTAPHDERLLELPGISQHSAFRLRQN